MSEEMIRRPRTLGFLMCRIVVPLWILTGVVFKLSAVTPKKLPGTMVDIAMEQGIDLFQLLWVLVSLEIFAAAVLFFVGRLARPMAIWMLTCFCAILLWEISTGAENCGCLGPASPPPWVMLAIDGGMLLLVLLGGRPYGSNAGFIRPLIMMAAATAIGTGIAFWRIDPLSSDDIVTEDDTTADASADDNPDDPAAEPPAPIAAGNGPWPAPPKRPRLYSPDVGAWEGKHLTKIPLMQWVTGWPEEILDGRAYVIVYSKSCGHCQSFLEMNFAAGAWENTVLVTVPDTPQGYDEATWLDFFFDRTGVIAELELPAGTDWFMTPPICVALEDGIVQCAKSGEDGEDAPSECLIYNP